MGRMGHDLNAILVAHQDVHLSDPHYFSDLYLYYNPPVGKDKQQHSWPNTFSFDCAITGLGCCGFGRMSMKEEEVLNPMFILEENSKTTLTSPLTSQKIVIPNDKWVYDWVVKNAKVFIENHMRIYFVNNEKLGFYDYEGVTI